jgi:hypothetical protein
MQLALVQPFANAARKPEALLVEELGGLHGGSGAVEGLEDQAHRRLYFSVWVENQNAVVPINQTDRRRYLKLAAPSLVEHPASHPRFEEMKFCFRHGPFQPEQEPIIEVCRVVDSILVENKCARQRTQLDQAVPVGGIPSQARDLQPHHQAGLAEGDLTDQLLKPVAAGRLGARLTEIAVDYVDTFERPAQCHGAIPQGVLALCALRVFQNLARCRLSNVKIGIVLQMRWSNLQFRHAQNPPVEYQE